MVISFFFLTMLYVHLNLSIFVNLSLHDKIYIIILLYKFCHVVMDGQK
jgi:hypothetical protein